MSNNCIECKTHDDKDKTISVKQYFEKSSSKDILISFKKSDAWKIQLRIAINSMSSKDTDKKRVTDSKSGQHGNLDSGSHYRCSGFAVPRFYC